MKLKDLVVKILVETAMPMTSEEIWKYALERKYDQLVNVKGKTPWNTISAQIYVDMKEEPNSNFIKVGRRPVKFSLANLEQNKPEEIKLFERTGGDR